MDRTEYALTSSKEQELYNGYKDHTEPLGVKLPGTKMGFEARQKAIQEGRVTTNKAARLVGKAPPTPGEQKTKDHLAKLAGK